MSTAYKHRQTAKNILDYDKYFTLTKQNLPTETKKFVEKLAEDNLVKNQDN